MILLPRSNAFLREEAARIRENYPTETEQDIATIARDKFGIHVVRSYLNFGRSIALDYGDESFIFYDGMTPESRRHGVAHELGHHVAGHLNSRLVQNRFVLPYVTPFVERQADLFALKLTGLDYTQGARDHEGSEAQDFVRIANIDEIMKFERERLAGIDPLFEEAFPWGDFENYLLTAQKIARARKVA